MAVRATSNIDLKIVGKYLLLCIVIFSGCNHCVRELAKNPPPVHTGINDWSLFATGPAISGANNTRQGLGRYFEAAANYCPKTGNSICKSTVRGIRFGLGLH